MGFLYTLEEHIVVRVLVMLVNYKELETGVVFDAFCLGGASAPFCDPENSRFVKNPTGIQIQQHLWLLLTPNAKSSSPPRSKALAVRR